MRIYEDVLMSLESIASGEDDRVSTEIGISANAERFKNIAIYAYYDHPEYSVYIDNFKCEYTRLLLTSHCQQLPSVR